MLHRLPQGLSKGGGLNAGFCHFRYRGWRLNLDADIVLPHHFRRVLMNHTALDMACLYGADRTDVIGSQHWREAAAYPQWGPLDEVKVPTPLRSRIISPIYGYLPAGYFQLWHATHHRDYPVTPGGSGLDDMVFVQQWPDGFRRLLPSVIVYHLCVEPPSYGENWDGIRRHPREE